MDEHRPPSRGGTAKSSVARGSTAAWELLVDQYMRQEAPPWAEEIALTPSVETRQADIYTPSAHLQEELLHRVEIPPLPTTAWTPPRLLPC